MWTRLQVRAGARFRETAGSGLTPEEVEWGIGLIEDAAAS